MTQTTDNFIMLPTVDICFKGLMNNPKVRQGFIAALLDMQPGEIQETSLLPTIMQQEYGDEKLKKCIHVSVLDFIHFPDDKRCYHKISFCDTKTGTPYTDLMELHILELKKLPEKAMKEEGIIRWMRFFGGKTKEDFKAMAGTDEYIEEAYGELEKLSADERKRLEYEAREKAVRDYNCLMDSALEEGLREGREQGLVQGREQGLAQGREQGLAQGLMRGQQQARRELAVQMLKNGMKPEDIMRLSGITRDEIEAAEKELDLSGQEES